MEHHDGGTQNASENPATAVESHRGSIVESHTKRETTPKKRKRRRKKEEDKFNIPGVFKVILGETAQETIGCVAGEHVTGEKPWILVEKEAVQDCLELDNSELSHLRNEIAEFPQAQMLLGYIPDESRDTDEFYLCVTEEATDTVKGIIERMQRAQEERLNNAINKSIKRWESLGSDKEVDENMMKCNRALIEVEIESKYPILPFKIQFRAVNTEQMRDGYMELKCTEDILSRVIFKKRVDSGVQVSPFVKLNEAQTLCSYPTNAYTQYEYVIPENPVLSEQGCQIWSKYVEEAIDDFYDLLRVNGRIDFYKNDYEQLILDAAYTARVKVPMPKEYLCFIDMNLCNNKMISSLCWHPMWTGLFVLGYVDIAPALYLQNRITTDEVSKAVHEFNPVLVWSFDDDLKPKLILETPREVYALSFCPYDENILIGGCGNGQIVLWDITNKLARVEQEEILTVNQQRYRDYMHELMSWMKNIFDLALVRPTALSDLKYSHQGKVNSITWMSPFHSISKTGKVQENMENEPHSLQLMTSAEDGTILIWDLLKKPTVAPGGFKAVRRLRRLKKRPSTLLSDESPFKMLHLNLKPIYKLNLQNILENRPIGISSFAARFFDVAYDLANPASLTTSKNTDRMIFKPILRIENAEPRRNFYVGTKEGDFLQCTWEGQEFDSGEVVNFEDCQILSHGRYHDGPVVSIEYSPINNAILTVGGRIFALWREDFMNRPLLWRKSASIYTFGCWYDFEEASMKLIRMDGYLEVWTLFYKSKEPLRMRLTSNGAVNITRVHPRRIRNNVFALCDYRGSVRLFYMPHQNAQVVRTKEESMKAFISREVDRKKDFLEWQRGWNERYLEKLRIMSYKEEEVKEPVFETVEHSKKKKKEAKATKAISAGERYLEYVKEQHAINEQERIKKIILEKKQMRTEELLKLREPLRKLEEEYEQKKRKQKAKIRDSNKLFEDTVAMLFPDAIKEKPPPPPDPYERCNVVEVQEDTFKEFQGRSIDAQDYVEEHAFKYDFNWVDVLKQGRWRRRRLDDRFERMTHIDRYRVSKDERAKEEAERSGDVDQSSSVQLVPKLMRSSSIILVRTSTMDVETEAEPEQEPEHEPQPEPEPAN